MVVDIARLDALALAGDISIPAIEDFPLVPHDPLELTLHKHILAERIHLVVGHQREQIGQLMKLERVHRRYSAVAVVFRLAASASILLRMERTTSADKVDPLYFVFTSSHCRIS